MTSAGEYKKRALTWFKTRDNRGVTPCDICDKLFETVMVLLRGGYVQEQLCLGCHRKKYGGGKEESV